MCKKAGVWQMRTFNALLNCLSSGTRVLHLTGLLKLKVGLCYELLVSQWQLKVYMAI